MQHVNNWTTELSKPGGGGKGTGQLTEEVVLTENIIICIALKKSPKNVQKKCPKEEVALTDKSSFSWKNSYGDFDVY